MYKIKTDGHPNSLGRMGGFLLCPLLPSTLPTPMPEEPLRVLLSLVPPTSKPIHLSLTGGDTILSMKSSFLISMSVCLESIPAIQGELNVRHVWRMAGVSFFFSSQYIWLCSIAPSLFRVLQDLQDPLVSVDPLEVW